MMDEGHVRDGMGMTDIREKQGPTTISQRLDAIEQLVESAHTALTELEAKISPVLRQEETTMLVAKEPEGFTTSDASAVMAQRLSSTGMRLSELNRRLREIYVRAEM